MIRLTDGMLLYHGSYCKVEQPDLHKCREGLDFGKGFYVTSSQRQAYNYVPGSVRKAIRLGRVSRDFTVADGVVNVYRFHADPNLLLHYYDEADIDWLHFVATNRDNTLFPALLRKLKTIDIIGGKVANDNTSRVLVNYLDGLFGLPGAKNADATAIQALLPNRLEDQFCFRTADAIATLEYVKSERYGDL